MSSSSLLQIIMLFLPQRGFQENGVPWVFLEWRYVFVIYLHLYSNSLVDKHMCISTHQGVRGPDGDRGEPGVKGEKVGILINRLCNRWVSKRVCENCCMFFYWVIHSNSNIFKVDTDYDWTACETYHFFFITAAVFSPWKCVSVEWNHTPFVGHCFNEASCQASVVVDFHSWGFTWINQQKHRVSLQWFSYSTSILK